MAEMFMESVTDIGFLALSLIFFCDFIILFCLLQLLTYVETHIRGFMIKTQLTVLWSDDSDKWLWLNNEESSSYICQIRFCRHTSFVYLSPSYILNEHFLLAQPLSYGKFRGKVTAPSSPMIGWMRKVKDTGKPV